MVSAVSETAKAVITNLSLRHLAVALLVFGDVDDVAGVLFEGVVVTDDDELGEAFDAGDLFGEVGAAFGVEVGRGFVEEGDIYGGHALEEGQADGEGSGHGFPAGELLEVA